jgi:hypothetical protein
MMEISEGGNKKYPTLRTLRPRRALSPDSLIASIMTTGSVLGCVKLWRPLLETPKFYYQRRKSSLGNTHVVGQGFLDVLSAQGSRDEHDNFQPAQMEYVGEPQAGQNLFLSFQSTILRASAKTAEWKASRLFIAALGSEKVNVSPF